MAQTDAKGHNPTRLDRWLLVRYKKFKSVDEIPNTVSSIMMRRVHERARIHGSLLIMLFAGIGMFANAINGKRHKGGMTPDQILK